MYFCKYYGENQYWPCLWVLVWPHFASILEQSFWSDGRPYFVFFLTSVLLCLLFMLHCLVFIHLKLIKTKSNRTISYGQGHFSFLDCSRHGSLCFLNFPQLVSFFWNLLHFNGEQQIKTRCSRPKHSSLPSTCAW